MQLWRKLVFLFIALSFSACASKYKQIELGSHVTRPTLGTEESVFISTPANGRYGEKLYGSSGSRTARVFLGAFQKHVGDVHWERTQETLEVNLQKAATTGYKYLAFSEIEHWEDRATEWSGKPDRIEVKVDIIEVATSKTLDSVLLVGSSKWATMGGDHPEDLLPEPVQQYVDSLYVA